jgi:hypothetical protein
MEAHSLRLFAPSTKLASRVEGLSSLVDTVSQPLGPQFLNLGGHNLSTPAGIVSQPWRPPSLNPGDHRLSTLEATVSQPR